MKPSLTPHQIAERVREFRLLTVAHPVLLAAKDQLIAAINEAPTGSIVMVFGPTGVGKTTLRLKVQQLLCEQTRTLLETDPSRLPFVAVEAAASDNANFRWRDHYYRTLIEFNEPMLDNKVTPHWIRFAQDSHGQQIVRSRAPAIDLRTALESAIRHRRPAAVLIDEAQHLTRMSSGRRVADQMEVIKSLANCTRTIHVLLGTYDLLALRHLNGQLGRRSLEIHFRRYSAENADDVRMFKNTVLSFQKQIPLDEQPDLMSLWDLLYERSVGCIGILKEWLDRALFAAFREGCGTLTCRHLEATALSAAQCEKIAMEAHEGQTQLLSAEQARPRLRELLGLEGGTAPSAKTMVHPKKRVGQRNPKRDWIGHAAAPRKAGLNV